MLNTRDPSYRQAKNKTALRITRKNGQEVEGNPGVSCHGRKYFKKMTKVPKIRTKSL